MKTIIESYQAGLFQKKWWLPNIISGVIVGVVALPLAMAFAIASGAKPEQGLYTAIVAGLLVSMFGGSRLQIAGPTGAFIVVLSGITSKYGIDGLQVASLIAGVMLLFFGMARLGAVIKFIPDPVILGFTVGIGISVYPYLLPHQVTLWEAAAPNTTLKFILMGVVIMLPILLGYTAFAFYLFRGKTNDNYH